MKLKYSIILTIAIIVLSCKKSAKQAATVGENAEVMSKAVVAESLYEDLDGNPIQLSDYKGNKLLLNFWATWCAPCIREMPALLKSQAILEKENYVFLLASDQSTTIIKKFKEQKNFDFKFIKFNGSLAELNIHALPTTFIYNEKGEKVEEIVGAMQWDSEETLDRLRNLE